jgi:hypothetical protein
MQVIAAVVTIAALVLALSTLWTALVPNAGRILAALAGDEALPASDSTIAALRERGHAPASRIPSRAQQYAVRGRTPVELALVA